MKLFKYINGLSNTALVMIIILLLWLQFCFSAVRAGQLAVAQQQIERDRLLISMSLEELLAIMSEERKRNGKASS